MARIKLPRNWLILLVITFFAFGQRFFSIQTNPPALNWDEVSHGYNAFSILKTGADEWGVKFPTIFRAFGDYKLPLYIYLTVIPVSLLGLTPIAVRLVSVLAGTLAVPAIYLLVNQLFQAKDSPASGLGRQRRTTPGVARAGLLMWNPLVGLLAAFLLAISPWHFFISRPALEANLALTLIIFGSWALLKGLKRPKFYLLSAVLLGLSLHTYNTARVFVPLLLVAFIAIYRPKFKLNLTYTISTIIITLAMSLVVYQVFSGTGTARYSKLAILSDPAVFSIGQDRSNSSLPAVLAKLRYNRPVYFLTQFSKNYLSYFSPGFIYQTQGAQSQFAIPGKNLFTLPILISSLIGIIVSFCHFKRSDSPASDQMDSSGVLCSKGSRSPQATLFLFSWLLASPVAAALTASPPQALRPNPMIPVIIIFASLGIFWISSLFKRRRWAQIAVLLSLILSCLLGYIRYLNFYYSSYPTKYSFSWQYGYQETVNFIEATKQNYDQIIFTKRYGEPHIFYAFFANLSPKNLQPGNNNIRFKQSDWFWTDKIDNIYFVNDWDIPQVLEESIPLESGAEVPLKNSLLIVSPQSLPRNAKILKVINFKNNQPAFIITEP